MKNLQKGVPRMNERKSFSLSIVTLSIVLAGTACTQNQATSPEEQFGFAIGTDSLSLGHPAGNLPVAVNVLVVLWRSDNRLDMRPALLS